MSEGQDFRTGTHRLVPPRTTLERIQPLLATVGITRCLDITGLDTLGIPVFCAVRPHSPVLQTSAGKGVSADHARVSALMESIELYHAETPEPGRLHYACAEQLSADGARVLPIDALPDGLDGHYSPRRRLHWVAGRELLGDTEVYAPASAVYFCEPTLYGTSTNGLASGNHPTEASLHALYELIERDAASRLSVDGKLKIRERARIVDVDGIDDEVLAGLRERIAAADSKLVLMWLPSAVPVHSFWAVLLNRAPFSAVSTLNIGYGTHTDPVIAAARAITEAAQSRVIFIHGSREDIMHKPVYQAHNAQEGTAYRYFDGLRPNASWAEVVESVQAPGGSLFQVHDQLLAALQSANLGPVYRFDLTKPDLDVPVVKVIAPGLRFNRAIF